MKSPRKTNSSTKPPKANDRATKYAKAVVAGKIIAGPHVRNQCRRHLDDLKRKELNYDQEAAERAIRFFETKIKLSEGQFENKAFKSQPSQDFIIGSLFGWKKPDGTRRFRRAYIEQGKGNGKSPLAGGVGLYGLFADGEAGAEIYSAGATKDQASVLFRDAVKMVRKSPALLSRAKFSGAEGNEYNIAFLKRQSFFRPVSRETKKTGSGPRPHFALIDELHEHPDSGTLEMLERGFKFRRNPLLFMITNSGSDRNSACYVEHEHAIKVAAGNRDANDGDAAYLGEIIDDTTFTYVCALDPGDDPLEDKTCWKKVNPLLGVTITEEYLEGVVSQARAIPSKLNNILRLHFCVWTEAEQAWMTRAALEPVLKKFDPIVHKGKRIWLGADLSQNKDITAVGAIVQTGHVESGPHKGKPTYDAWALAWTPKDTMAERELIDKLPYTTWVAQGFLQAPDGKSISYRQVAQALVELDRDYEVMCLAYDRYAFRSGLEPEMIELGLQMECIEHPQGGTKKGKPNEEMKKVAEAKQKEPEGLWMPASVRLFEDLVTEERIRIIANPAVISAIMSAVTERDRWGNYWLSKLKAFNKIDIAIAIIMAAGAAAAYDTGAPKKEYQMMII